MSYNPPPFVRDLLAAPPRAGEGVHQWLYSVSRQLHAHLPAIAIVALLESRVAKCGRLVSRSEIVSAVQNSLSCAWQPSGITTPRPTALKWPILNRVRREAILAEGHGLCDLWERSRPRIEDNSPHTEEIIERLFPGNPLLCIGKYAKKPDGESYTVFETRPREAWCRRLSEWELIVPSPMTAITGLTKSGQKSAHALSNTGARRFLICEFDTGELDAHAALLLHLGTFAPLICAVHSGNKSLHGWFYVHGQPAEKIETFFRYAVSLGADPATWTRSQFVRMPDGTRNTGKRQTVYYLNFRPVELKP
jgi:hypothetical protein